jgi:hypothetical protein
MKITKEQLRTMRKRADREIDISRGYTETGHRIHKSKKDWTRKVKHRDKHYQEI